MEEKEVLYNFGCNIRAERSRLRLSLEDLAAKTSITAKHLGKIERGEANPRLTSVIEIMDALGVPFETLYSKK